MTLIGRQNQQRISLKKTKQKRKNVFFCSQNFSCGYYVSVMATDDKQLEAELDSRNFVHFFWSENARCRKYAPVQDFLINREPNDTNSQSSNLCRWKTAT